MPALNFKKQFAPRILSGEKPFTLRYPRKDGRDPRSGQPLYLYTGQRTKHASQFAINKCTYRWLISIGNCWMIIYGRPSVLIVRPNQLHRFAQFDGFANYQEFCEFHEIHDGMKLKRMFMIGWTDWPSLASKMKDK